MLLDISITRYRLKSYITRYNIRHSMYKDYIRYYTICMILSLVSISVLNDTRIHKYILRL